MNNKGWIEYNHCLISNVPPHLNGPKEIPSYLYMLKNRILMARWITNWDCKHNTEWWYCIKDGVLDIECLKAKRRYEIKKGINNFTVAVINPLDYVDEIYDVFLAAYSGYPSLYRPKISLKKINNNCCIWHENNIVIGCFDRERKFSGCAILTHNGDFINFNLLRVKPEYQKLGINFAIVYYICETFIEYENIKYISDGERNIRPITAFQDYLIKYFGFRKAYCNLCIKYNPIVKLIVYIVYPFKGVILRLHNKNELFYNIHCFLNQEQIRRTFL